jgi:tetratricopeptide (TPR) repeat protein
VRRLTILGFAIDLRLPAALLAAAMLPAPLVWAAGEAAPAARHQAGDAGAARQATAIQAPSDRDAAAAREASLQRIERLRRTGKPGDARRLMPLLKDPDERVSREAEQAIWLVWGRSGNPGIDRLFRSGMSQMGRDEIHAAIETFTRVVENLPTFAEAWNKRATARFLAGDLIGAMDDCERVLALVPDHFGSLAGYGHIYFRMNDLDMAILYWQRALEVNPNLHSVARSIDAAEKLLARRGRLRA